MSTTMRVLRLRVFAAAIAFVGIAAACSAGGSRASESTTSTSIKPPTSVGTEANVLSAAAARADIAALTKSEANVESVLAQAVRTKYAAAPSTLLPTGSTVTIDGAPTVDGSIATVPVLVKGPHPGRWLVLFVDEQGQWRVYGTRAEDQ